MPKTSTLVDTFDTKDTATWTWGSGASVSGGNAVLVPNSSYSGGIETPSAVWDLTDSEIVFDLAQRSTGTGGSIDNVLSAHITGINENSVGFRFNTNGANLTASRYVGTAGTTLATVTYNATSHRYLRLRHTSPGTPTLYWETSPDQVTWTQLASWASPSFALTALKVQALSGGTATGMTNMLLAAVNPASTADTTAPTAPTGVAADAVSGTQVDLGWSASTDDVGVVSYRVRRDGVDVTGGTAVAGLSFSDTTALPGERYSYTVSAVDAAGNRSAEAAAPPVSTPDCKIRSGGVLVNAVTRYRIGGVLVPAP